MAAICVLLYRFDNKYTYPGDTGLNGAAVFEESTFHTRPVVFLTQGWEFYQHKLLSPGDFEAPLPAPDVYVHIGQYPGFEHGDYSTVSHGNATYRICLSLPEIPRSYALELPEIYSSCRVYVNGALLAQRGNPDPKAYRPEIKTGIITFWAGGQAEIIIAAGDDSHLGGGIVYPPMFGLPEAVSAMVGKRLILRAVVCFAALLLGAAYIASAIRQRSRLKASCGLACLFFMGYTCYPLIHLAGWPGSLLLYRVENICCSLTLLMVLYLQSSLCGVPVMTSRFAAVYGFLMCLPSVLLEQSYRSIDGPTHSLMGAHKLIVFAYLLAAALYAAGKRTLSLRPLSFGVTAFGAALLMDKLLPVFAPVYTGWFPELGGAALVICLGADICFTAARSGHETLALRRELGLLMERVHQADNLIRLQTGRFEALREDIDETRRKDHDMRHHISLLRELLRICPDKAAVYMDELNSSLPPAEESLCGNIAADCVIRQYISAARSQGIVVEAAVNIPPMPGISDIDLSIVLSNLLENALEALRAEPKTEKRIIRISAGTTGSMLTINVDNSLCKPLRYRDGILQSRKRNGPGVGLTSVSAVSDKYDGNFWWKTEDGMFRSYVALNMEEQVIQYENCCM